ncbi:uncharacterized protein LOC132544458 [Ylistrum balloti]|uniref:uncharacterized protein LOC132544458 n=1 Tax=Ylistrum balloti TaxID=509963 RepID=UPI002905818B|nr:uncharacterized protein LOC132544458 [Ylistrum balloti]
MSSTSVLGKNPNTIDMAPGHGSIVDGVDAEVLLNSNANIHGIINIRDPGTAKSPSVNSLLGNTKLENTKNRTPYPRFHASGRANDIHFGAHRMEIKSVNGEARPVEEIGSSTQEYVKVPKGSKGNKIVNQSAIKTENNGLNIAGNKNIVQSQVGTDKASTSTTSNSWSEYSPNPPHKDANTKRTTQPTFLEAAGNRAGLNKGEGEQQTASDTAGPQSGAQIQPKALRRTQGPNPGGFGASWMEGMGGTGAWKAAARKEARELVLEKEGHWRSVNITTIGRKSDMCPVYDVTYQENAVILSTGHNSCKIVITWHQRPKSRPFQQQTPFGMTNHFVTRMRYVPVVTYVNAR